MDGRVKLPAILIFLLILLCLHFVQSIKHRQPDWYQKIRKITNSQRKKLPHKCPEKCVCFNEENVVVRCMFLRWRKIPKIHENTERLWVQIFQKLLLRYKVYFSEASCYTKLLYIVLYTAIFLIKRTKIIGISAKQWALENSSIL